MKRRRPDSAEDGNLKLTQTHPVTDSCLLVIFGAGGDLTKRMLIPAIYNLEKSGLLPEKFAVVGFSIEKMSDDQFRKNVVSALKKEVKSGDLDPAIMHRLVKRFHYFQGDLLKIEGNHHFKSFLLKTDRHYGTQGNILFYLATPPDLFGGIAHALSHLGLTHEDQGWRHVVLEKPFGHDLESAIALNQSLSLVLRENQIYRIDHYLGKETVQNILVFRFANGIYEPIWNRRYIDSVQITVAETLGVEHRAAYYEHAGALRDMVSSHVLQLLTLVAMEAPGSFQADDVRDEKVKVLKAIKPLMPEDVLRQTVRGQYDRGVINGQAVPAYRDEPGVSKQSAIETYVAMKLEVENWRWSGVPFYVRVGKRLPDRYTEIAIQFKSAPFQMFRDTHEGVLPPNFLVMHIQPQEKIALDFTAKVPGPSVHLGGVRMEFNYVDFFGRIPSTGYETLLHDCMSGDGTLFRRADQVEWSWRAIMPILDVWSALHPKEFPNYSSGSWGPEDAEMLLKRDGRQWRKIVGAANRRILKRVA